MSYNHFLSPGQIGNLKLKNRSIFPPMGSGFPNLDGTVSERLIDYHVRRVFGGCAMNIVEIASVHYTSQAPAILGIYDDRFIPGLSRLAQAIKDAGGVACIQIWHGGRQTSGKPYGGKPIAPSSVLCEFIGEEPQTMTINEIKEIISAYGDSALRAKEAGFDAVEIHGAHGYLIDSFLQPYTNTRTDEYGGSLENRTRFGCEVIQDVRSKVGKDFPILFRMSAKANVEGGILIEEGIQAAKYYEAAGIDALDISQGGYDALPYTVPPYYLPFKVNAYHAHQIKQNTNIPIIVAGRIISPDAAEEILTAGMADFISLGRPLLTDPDFVKKTIEGNIDDIVRCISCNQACVGRLFAGKGVSCIFNPAAGYEKEVVISPAEKKKKVLIIGGGPGGLEAARIARIRGHDVVLFEKGVELGGQFIIAGQAPHKRIFAESAIQMGYRAYRAGVDIRVFTEATPDRIKEINPDIVIVATGSDPLIPDIPGIENTNVFEARSLIAGRQYVSADNVVIIGGGLIGLEAMEILTAQGKKVSIIEMLDEVGKDIALYIKPYIFDLIRKNGVELYTDSECIEITESYAIIEKKGNRNTIECGAVIIAAGSKSNTGAVDMVKNLGYDYRIIGDALEPAKIREAIWGGNEIARQI